MARSRTDYRNDIKKMSDDRLLKHIDHLWYHSEYDERNFRMHTYAKTEAEKRGILKTEPA